MSRYNHFKELKHKGVEFSSLGIGDEFSNLDKPFKIHIKTGPLEYKVKKTNEKKRYFNEKAIVYIKTQTNG